MKITNTFSWNINELPGGTVFAKDGVYYMRLRDTRVQTNQSVILDSGVLVRFGDFDDADAVYSANDVELRIKGA